MRITNLKYNQALSKVQELQAKLPEAGEGTKKGGWVGDESLNLSMRGLLSIQKKSNRSVVGEFTAATSGDFHRLPMSPYIAW